VSIAIEKQNGTGGPGAGARLGIDLGPLAIFFLANAFAPVREDHRIFVATGAFMAAMAAAMLFSRLRYRHISPMLLFSGLMVLVFGGITIWLQNETFIKMKPTLLYLTMAAILLFGLVTGRNLLKTVLGTAYPGLSDRGWQLLTRNWIGFFVVMALANEAIWRTQSTTFWAGAKLWLFVPAVFLFAILNVPMLLKHGLQLETAREEPPIPPVE
jgi:intracellular septation protein